MFMINHQKIGVGEPPFIIAELSANHNGSLELALDTIQAAKQSGADAIKLQTYSADTMTIPCDKPDFQIKGGLWDGYNLYQLYQWAQTPFEWHQAMFEYARKIGITVFSTPFDESAVDLLERLDAPAYKIASFEMTDLPLIEYVAKKRKPMIISTGMATEDEIGEAVEVARRYGTGDLVLLHCISSYPTPVSQSNLRQMAQIGKTFNSLIGLSDHTLGTTVSIGAVALGACVIEKHFTLSRKNKGPDSEFSIEPDELLQLTRDAKDTWLALGNGNIERQDSEIGSRVFRRSIYFVNDCPAGHQVTEADIRRIRPGMGLAPKYFDQVVGKKLKQDVTRGTATSWELFDE